MKIVLISRTHGCLRLHQNAAREFFTLARVGTPVYIARSQLKDASWGPNAPRPPDYNDPDPPSSILTSLQAFKVDPNKL